MRRTKNNIIFYSLLLMRLVITSCKKEQKGCMLNKTALFYVENQSKDTANFTLIQNDDTIRETILPYKKYNYTIKAGEITKSYLYRADTLYRKTMDDWKCKRCEMDGHLIR